MNAHVLEPNAVWIYMSPNHYPHESPSSRSHYILGVSYLPPDFVTVAGLIPEAIICSSKIAYDYRREWVGANAGKDVSSTFYDGNLLFKRVLSDTVRKSGATDPARSDLVYYDQNSRECSLLENDCHLSSLASNSRTELGSSSLRNGQRLFCYRDGRSSVHCGYKTASMSESVGCASGDADDIYNSNVSVNASDVLCYFLQEEDGTISKSYGSRGYIVVTSNGPPRLSSHIHKKLMRKLYRMTIEQAQHRGKSQPVTLVSSLKL